MPFDPATPRAFTPVSINAHAPAASGVYGVSNAREWIFIGESDNIRQALLQHLGELGSSLVSRQPTGFVFEVCERGRRTTRHDRLVVEYGPWCNAGGQGRRQQRSPAEREEVPWTKPRGSTF